MEKIQESIQSLVLNNHVPIIRFSCLAHVIQLSLKELLGYIKADPTNDVVLREWSDTQMQSLRARHRRKEIANALAKVQ